MDRKIFEIYYNDAEKSFSPAWNRQKYIRNIQGISDEFCHNIFRLILRPNSKSAKHWFNESINWLNDAIGIKLSISKKPVWYLFSFILDENKESFPIGTNSRWMFNKVWREFMYGTIINEDYDYVVNKITELYHQLDPNKIYADSEVYNLYYNWYKSINGAKLEFKPESPLV